MKLRNIVALFFLTACTASAQTPATPQATPVKVGVVNSAVFSNATGGINRLVNALRTLDTEFKPRRDEITQLRTRFDSLQQPLPANATSAQIAARQEQIQTLQVEIRRKQEDGAVAYNKRFATLTDPIRQSVFTALQAYAKQRGVDVLIDVSKFPDGILLLNQNADMTSAFIRDFNSKNP